MKKDNKNSLIKELLRLGAILTVICIVVAGIVAFVYESTKDQIALNNKISKSDLAVVMPDSDSIVEITADFEADETVFEIYKAMKGSDIVGYVYKTNVTGYKPDVEVLVGVDIEGAIVATMVTKLSETPGVGALVKEEKYISQFSGKVTAAEFKVVKTTPAADNEIECVSGATISSTAVVSAVNCAVKFNKENILGEEVVEETPAEPTIENMLLAGDEMVEILGEQKAIEVKSAGVTTGYIVYAENTGYSEDGPIEVAVAFDKETKKITNIMVTKQSETEGIGNVIEEEGFAMCFQGKDALEQETQVYSGASLSSKGAIGAINKAITYFNDVLLQGGN